LLRVDRAGMRAVQRSPARPAWALSLPRCGSPDMVPGPGSGPAPAYARGPGGGLLAPSGTARTSAGGPLVHTRSGEKEDKPGPGSGYEIPKFLRLFGIDSGP
jgi:hypothetical protein